MTTPDPSRPAVRIRYCTLCNWLLRANWMAAELLSTFGTELGSVTLLPDTGGVFRVDVDGVTVWDRSTDGGFPDAAELKRRVRDAAFPDRDLGHGDMRTS
ncbi:SelT/SelW/SelH family protein [Williamsia sp. SKLECPSW1]